MHSRAGLGCLEETFQPQPQVDPDAAMDPRNDEDGNLQHPEVRRGHPKRVKFLRVALLQSELDQRHARGEQVIHQQERNQETQAELGDFGPGPAEVASLIERPQAQDEMRRQSEIKRCRPEGALPDPFLYEQAGFHRSNRYVAEGMVQQVGADVGEQRKPGHQTQRPQRKPAFAVHPAARLRSWRMSRQRPRPLRLAGSPPVHSTNPVRYW